MSSIYIEYFAYPIHIKYFEYPWYTLYILDILNIQWMCWRKLSKNTRFVRLPGQNMRVLELSCGARDQCTVYTSTKCTRVYRAHQCTVHTKAQWPVHSAHKCTPNIQFTFVTPTPLPSSWSSSTPHNTHHFRSPLLSTISFGIGVV